MNWSVPKHDFELIGAIAKRAAAVGSVLTRDMSKRELAEFHRTIVMDLTACHANGNKLRLQDLLDADSFNFTHDVFGIYNHIDRNTGELRDCFVPRFSAVTHA